MVRISVNAILCVQNNEQFYISVLDSEYLKKMCFVSRKKEDPKKGFQRLLNVKRAKAIAQYLDVSKGIIPSALIVSAQDNAKIRYDEKKHILSFDIAKESLLVIDGQHRLYGLIEAEKNYQIPVVIFENLTSSQEVRLFIDINTTQKGVPTALLLDIKGQAGTETKLEERQRELFDRLNQDSALAGYFLPNESKTGKISRTVFNQSTKIIYETGPVSQMDDEIIYKTVKNYIEAVDSLLKETNNKDARLNKTILFKGFMGVFNEVCDKCLIKYKNLKVESFREYLSPIIELNYSEYTGTNKTTENKIINDIKNSLQEILPMNEDIF